MSKCFTNIDEFITENVLLVRAEDPTNCEYQVRYIDGPVYYKRQRGQEEWKFATAEEFCKNVNQHNIIPWQHESDF